MVTSVPIFEEEAPSGEVTVILVPLETYRAISQRAAMKNMTASELIAKALDSILSDD